MSKTKMQPEPTGDVEVPADQKATIDRWLQDVTYTAHGALHKLFDTTEGFSFRNAPGRDRIDGFADPDTGVKIITSTSLPPCWIKLGHYHQGDRGLTQPDRVVSVASGFHGTFERVLRLVCGDDFNAMEQSLQSNFPHYRPQMQWFFGARDGAQEALETTEKAAIQKVLRVDHDCCVELCRFHALDKGMVADWIQENDVPFKRVKVTPQGEIVDPIWYSPGVQPIADIDDLAQQQRMMHAS